MRDLSEFQGQLTRELCCIDHLFPKKRQVDSVRSTLKSLGTICILATIFSFWFVISTWTRPFPFPANSQHNVTTSQHANSVAAETKLPTEIKALLQKIKDARMIAEKANPNATAFTEPERQAWHERNPCASRQELWPLYNERRHSHILQQHPYLGEILREYSALHRACMQNVGKDPVEFFLRKDTTSGCKFILGDNEIGTGIGNKILSATAQVLYAILTQRVLLVPTSTSIPGIMCEPFEGSSWKITADNVLIPGKKHPEQWRHVADVYRAVDELHHGETNATAIYSARVNEDNDCQPQKRFFCDTEQEFYASHVTWMYFSECLYYLPKLFAIPRFRPTLEALFPDRLPLTHLLRTALLPTDSVWLRVQQLIHVHLKHVDHRIGIQARYFHGRHDFDLFHTATQTAVANCLLKNHLLPNTTSETLTNNLKTYLVFITSLYDSLKDHLTNIYIRNPSTTREAVGILQLTHEDSQQFGEEVDRQALTEVLGLSLSDELLVTPQSTFGAIAAGYGGLVPWMIDIRTHASTGGCVRGQSVDACYQLPSSKRYECPHDGDVDQKVMADMVPYLRDCHLIEKPAVEVLGAGLGLQIVSHPFNVTVGLAPT